MSSVCVLMVAAGAAWESTALGLLTAHPRVVVLKRCVDVNDLLGTATAGQADVAVLALDAHGFDVAAVEHLRRHRVRPVAVAAVPHSDAARARAARLGVAGVVGEHDLESLPRLVVDADAAVADEPAVEPDPREVEQSDPEPEFGGGRTVAVWGPAGAPGRTTVALGLAAEVARRGEPAMLVDADPYGGAVAQHLGIMDEVSGLLAAARLSGTGELGARFAGVPRAVAPRLSVVTGLPRADRWPEIRPGAVAHLAEVAAPWAHVVVDTGFSLEVDVAAELGSVPGRNSMTLGALEAADEIVVVGSADPVGLSRLARGLVELRERTRDRPVRVVVNRMRASLGWSQADIAGMVEGFAPVLGLHFLPEDRAAVDRALIAGRTLTEVGDSALPRALAEVADAVVPGLPGSGPGRGRVRRRRAGRAPRR